MIIKIQKYFKDRHFLLKTNFTLFITYLLVNVVAINAFVFRGVIINFERSHHLAWILLMVLPLLISTIIAAVFCWNKRIKWDKSSFLKWSLITMNFISLSLVIQMALPIVFIGLNWWWILLLPISTTLLKLIIYLLINKYKTILITHILLIVLLGIVPLIFGIVFKNNILITGATWVIAWELICVVWDAFLVKKLSQKKSITLYPFALLGIPLWLFVAIMTSSGIFFTDRWLGNPFNDDND
ncbi:MAG: hypothetical protein HRT98_02380 [Mycoplasmatales bacterium]|nr:hypothetical protein [Mycoplasmatales bacterium]